MRRWIAVLTVTTLVLAGCVDQGGLPPLQGTVGQDTAEWGQAVQFTITNIGETRYPAPLTVEVVALNGTVVRTFPDVTGGHGLPSGAEITMHWNGMNDAGRPVLWGNYTIQTADGQADGLVQLLRPPNYALRVDPIPEQTEAGEPMTFRVENGGNIWLNGSLNVLAGRQDEILYNNTAEVRLPPGGHYDMKWNGDKPNGEQPEAERYVVAARMTLQEGPEPFAQDVFRLTEPGSG